MKNQKTRRLAAIMFTDIVGYTALMQQDENAAAEVRAHHRKEFQQYHEIYNGEILQYFGDGTLSVFQSGVEAVECAIAIQKALNIGEAPEGSPSGPQGINDFLLSNYFNILSPLFTDTARLTI